MLERLYVDNYRCLVNFDLTLQEMCLLVGANGTGKTSVLDIMFALRRLLDGSGRVTDDDVFPTRTLTRWQDRDLQTIEVTALLDGDPFKYTLRIEHDRPTRRARVVLEELTRSGKPRFKCERGDVTLFRDDFSRGPQYTVDWTESALARVAPEDKYPDIARFRNFMRRLMVCSFYPPNFRTESQSEAPVLERDSRNFVDWYRHAVQERPEFVHDFIEQLREMVLSLHGIRLKQVGTETRELVVEFTEQAQTTYEIRFDELSDGQRALIALYALVYMTPEQGYTYFLDEPDNYVALREIQPWLSAMEDACGKTVSQVVLTSHHPELIDYLGVDGCQILRREESGIVNAARFEVDQEAPGLKLSELIARGWHA